MNNKWTPEQDDILRKLWPTELTRLAIATRLCRPVEGISRRASRLGLQRKKPGHGGAYRSGVRGKPSEVDNVHEFINQEEG